MQMDIFQSLCDDGCADPQLAHVFHTLFVDSTTNPKSKDHKLGIKASERQGFHQLVVLILLLGKLLKMSGVRGVSPLLLATLFCDEVLMSCQPWTISGCSW